MNVNSTPGHITLDDHKKLPSFTNNADAIKWFKSTYGDKFIYVESDYLREQKCYIYYLILDELAYFSGHSELKNIGRVTKPMRFLASHQKIEIFEDGHIHIYYL